MVIQKISKMTHEERIQRSNEKRAEVLKIARRMGWVNIDGAAELLDVTRPAAARTLKGMALDGLLCLHELPGMPKRIWFSISDVGMDEASFLEDLPLSSTIQAGRWKIAPQNYQHEQDVLITGIKVKKAGAEIRLATPEGRTGRAMSEKFPDLLIDTGTQVFGIEVEREVKSRRRYRILVANHWLAIERGYYDKVMYLSPDLPTRDRLARIVKSVFEAVRIGGQERALTDRERQCFGFATYEQGINYINKIRRTENIR